MWRSFGPRCIAVAMVTASVALACGDKGADDLFDCDAACMSAGGAGKVGGGGAVSASGFGSGGASGGRGSGGSSVGGAAPGAGSGGSVPAAGGKLAAAGGGAGSGGKTGSGGAGGGGTQASGGSAPAASGGGNPSTAGSGQGGASTTAGGTGGGAGDASAGAAGTDAGSRTIQIGGLLDAYVDSCEPEHNTNSASTFSVDADPCVLESYIKPASLSDIPTGATIRSALLELQCIDAGDPVQVRQIVEEWSERSVDWENRPSLGEEVGSFEAAAGPVVIDITSLVEEWVGGARANGVALVQTLTDGSDYHSSESGQSSAPRILVTYTP